MKLTPPLPPSDNDFKALKSGLNSYNESFTGDVFNETIASFVKNDMGEMVGGILAEINWSWLHIKGLWLAENIRTNGWGSKLIQQFEEYAISKGVFNIRLETTTFQALGFYQKLGYSTFGELPDMPPGYTSYFLHKHLKNNH